MPTLLQLFRESSLKTITDMTVTTSDNEIEISLPGTKTSLRILKYGATVVSWKIDSVEQLWLSTGSKLDGSRAIRGGIPLVFPRFGPPGKHAATDKLPQHGFARSSEWEFLGKTNETTVQFGLGPENVPEEMQAAWPYEFTLVYTVALKADHIDLKLTVANTGEEPFDFNVLFHTYFHVPEVEKVTVSGLSSMKYWNKVTGSYVEKDEEPAITFTSETDRVYAGVPHDVEISFDGRPLYSTHARNLPDVVVWNPWTGTANVMTDFEPKSGFHQMICVENGSVAQFTELASGGTWEGGVALHAHL